MSVLPRMRASSLWLRLSFFSNDPATTEIYTLSLHDALPIWVRVDAPGAAAGDGPVLGRARRCPAAPERGHHRSEEHTSELQSRVDLVCRLLLEKKKTKNAVRQPSVHAAATLQHHMGQRQ